MYESDIYLCGCCVMARENADTSGCEFYCTRGDEHPAGLLGALDGLDYAMTCSPDPDGVDGECAYDEYDFSTVACDGCRTHLAGGRFGYTLMD